MVNVIMKVEIYQIKWDGGIMTLFFASVFVKGEKKRKN